MRYFILGILFAFVLYWATTGLSRRFFPRRRELRSDTKRTPVDPHRQSSNPPVDYSNARDVDYQDL